MSSTGAVHIYARVSTVEQGDNFSLDSQIDACRQWAQGRDLAVASVTRETWSGADRHRPALDALIDRLAPGDLVLCHDLDRLSRGGVVDCAIIIGRIEDAGAATAFVLADFEQSEVGAFVRSARAFAAALEREKLLERTARGKKARVLAGAYSCGNQPPYGFTWRDPATKAALDLDPATAPIVQRIFREIAAGCSARAMVARLAAEGVPSPRGNAVWSRKTIIAMINNPVYAGRPVAFRWTRTRGAAIKLRPVEAQIPLDPSVAPALVDEATALAARAVIANGKIEASRNNRDPEATLLRAGIARCGYCRRNLIAHNLPGRTQYQCSQRGTGRTCPPFAIEAHVLDAAVWAKVSEVILRPEIVAAEVDRHRQDGGLDRDAAALAKHVAAIAGKQARLAKAIAAVEDDVAAAPLLAELHALAAQRKAAETEQAAMARRIADRAAEGAAVRSLADWCRQAQANLDALGYDGKRTALRALGVEVKVWRRDHSPRYEITMRPGIVEPSST
jgi:site-specific DNA recombinase